MNEYKVIRLVSTSVGEFSFKYKFDSSVSVYTLGTGSWRNLEEDIMQNNMSLCNYYIALVNGALHWYASTSSQWRYASSSEWCHYVHDVLVSFDLRDETFQEIPQPDTLNYGLPYRTIVGELGGCLSIFCRHQHEDIEIWVMKEYGVIDSWTKQFNFGRPEISGSFVYLQPVAFANNGKLITMKNSKELVLYDPRTTSTRDLNSFEFEVYDPYAYTPSLISPRILNGVMHVDVKGD